MRIIQKKMLLFLFVFCVHLSFGQTKTIVGKVTDPSGSPLKGTSVLVKGSKFSSITDMEGNYSIKVEEGKVLVFSYIGYSNKEIEMLKSIRIDVMLEPSSQVLEEMVVPAHNIENKNKESFKIAFGSCAHQDKDQPLLRNIAMQQPNLFIYLGDNIYGDTRDMDVLKGKYSKLASKVEFQELTKSTNILSVWDDHDFGENDEGRHYPFKKESKEIFMDFWKIAPDSDRRKHEGIYGVEYIQVGTKKLQILLLDTRTFRDDLIQNKPKNSAYKNYYIPNSSKDSTLLGETQWKWLKNELLQPADVRIVASSLQFGHEYNGYESWTNLPQEQAKFIDLIRETKANGIIFISGDVHWGEISKMITNTTYPLYDVTSSGITQTWYSTESNSNRVGPVITQNNYGVIEIFHLQENPAIQLSLFDKNGEVNRHVIHLSDLTYTTKK
jgi:alkaline phosphatase D